MPIKVLVTGGGGRLGRALSKIGGARVHGVASSELDITDVAAFQNSLERLNPDAVINAATLGIDACNADPDRARRVNGIAPGDMAKACRAVGSPFIQFRPIMSLGMRLIGRGESRTPSPQ